MTNNDDGQMGLFATPPGQGAVTTLVDRLTAYNAAYRRGAPEVSDDTYAQLTEELRRLAPQHQAKTQLFGI